MHNGPDISDFFLPLEQLHKGVLLAFRQSKGFDDASPAHAILVEALPVVQTNQPTEARRLAWRELLSICPQLDIETARSVYHHFLQVFPHAHDTRVLWLKRELSLLLRVQKLLQKETSDRRQTIAKIEAKKCGSILAHELQRWCDGSYSTGLWRIRIICALLQSGAAYVPKYLCTSVESLFEGLDDRSVTDICAAAVRETRFDPFAGDIWYLHLIAALYENAPSCEELLSEFAKQALLHKADPFERVLSVDIGEGIRLEAPYSISNRFPELAAKLRVELQSVTKKVKERCEPLEAIASVACISGMHLSFLSTNSVLHSWLDFFTALEREGDSAETLLAASLHACWSSPTSIELWLHAYYHVMRVKPANANALADILAEHWPVDYLPVYAIVRAIEAAAVNDLPRALEAIDSTAQRMERLFEKPIDTDTIVFFTIHKLSFIFSCSLRHYTDSSVYASREYKLTKEVVMQAVKRGATNWRIFTYLCCIEAHIADAVGNIAHGRRVVTAILAQASKNAGDDIAFLHRRIDFAPLTENFSELTAAFEHFIQRSTSSKRKLSRASCMELWGRFYDFLKPLMPSAELEAYEHRRDRVALGYGCLIAEKSWRGDGVVETRGTEDNVPLTALQKLVLSLGPPGYEALMRRYSPIQAASGDPLEGLVSLNEMAVHRSKDEAWRHLLDTDEELKKNLREIGLRVLFDADEDCSQSSAFELGELPDHGRHKIVEPLPFMLEKLNLSS